jgi:predicted DNA-binding ribbon-helix-helix protein
MADELAVIPVRLERELFDCIHGNAADDGLTMSEYIARLLDEHVPRPGTLEHAIAAAVKEVWLSLHPLQ